MKSNVMVDLETLGNGSDAVILSIGAVTFDEAGLGEEFYTLVDPQSCVEAGLRMDASTVMWWMGQSEAARAAFTREPSPILALALVDFSRWFEDSGLSDACVWGNGATFDNVILSNAYKAIGLKRPWGYRNDRCYRTLKALYPWVEPVKTGGVAHNALADAKYQALHAAKILAAMKGATYG